MNKKYKVFQISILLLISLVMLMVIASRGCPKRTRNRTGSSSFTINSPSNLTATVISYTRVDISWNDNALNNDGYAIERKESAGGTWVEIIRVGDVTAYSDENQFLFFTTYYYRVRAYNSLGDYSDYSNEVGIIPVPTPIWTDIAVGDIHTLARNTDGTLWAWGFNNAGQLGASYGVNRTTPMLIQYDQGWSLFTGIELITAGGYHSLASKSNRTLWSWGQNNNGQLGLGDTQNADVPFPIGADSDWSKITGGGSHTIALKTNSTIWAWGFNGEGLEAGSGQLGLGDSMNRNTPTRIGNDSDWSDIAAGNNHTIALKTNSTLWAWGWNSSGQLGDGTIIDRTTPRQIGNNSDWSKIAGGDSHTIALKTNSTLWSWGYNNYGQLGDGTTSTRNTPRQIGNDSDWSKIAGGGSHTIALKTNSTLWSWGRNNYGQLGLGITTDYITTPTQIGNDSDWSKIAGGFGHTIALKTNSTLWAWGWNEYGQLGLGNTINRNVPTLVGE